MVTAVTADVDRSVSPDLELLRATADGDSGAFEELVRRHQDRVIAVCQRLLGDREEARDAAQEVFLKVFRKAGRFRPDAKVSTWLYRIAVNHCLNQLRRRKVARFFSLGAASDRGGDGGRGGARGSAATAPAGAAGPVGRGGGISLLRPIDPVDPAPRPDAALTARRRWQATRRALDALPESQRAVVVLAKFEELSYDEIAEILGTSNSSVASRLFRAMRQLEKALAVEDEALPAGEGGAVPRGSDGSRVS